MISMFLMFSLSLVSLSESKCIVIIITSPLYRGGWFIYYGRSNNNGIYLYIQ